MIPLVFHPLFLRTLLFTAWLLCVRALAAQQMDASQLSNWPIPTPPPHSNSAVFPVPRNEWLAHFDKNLQRARGAKVDLIFDGDSITDYWPSKAQEVWTKNYARLNPVDFAISGDRTEHLLWRLDHGQVEGLHPKMVALMIGTNNLPVNTDEQVAEGVTFIVHEYRMRCPDAVILLQAIFPRAEKATDPFRRRIQNINEAISKLADGKRVVFVNFGDKFLQPDGTLPRDIMPDSLHPNVKGYEIWADAIRPEIEKVLGPVQP